MSGPDETTRVNWQRQWVAHLIDGPCAGQSFPVRRGEPVVLALLPEPRLATVALEGSDPTDAEMPPVTQYRIIPPPTGIFPKHVDYRHDP